MENSDKENRPDDTVIIDEAGPSVPELKGLFSFQKYT